MAGDITLRTVLVGLNNTGNGVDFDIEFDTYNISGHLQEIGVALKQYFSGTDVDVNAIVASYQKTPPVLRTDGSPFDVVASGPTVFLYVINQETAGNWRFTEGGKDFRVMSRKADAKIPAELFEKNWGEPFVVAQDEDGVIMYGIYAKCVDCDTKETRKPKWRFAFDIFMQVEQGDGRVTQITIDPDGDNQEGDPIGGGGN